MKIKQIKDIMESWSLEEKALTVSPLSGHYPRTFYTGKPVNYWISLNIEYINNNLEQEINFSEQTSKHLYILTYLLAFSKRNKTQPLIELIKNQSLGSVVLKTINCATYLDISHQSRSNYYFTVTDCLKNNCFDLIDFATKNDIKLFFKRATVENNKKYYSEALCSIAEYMFDNKDRLDKVLVLEMLEYFLITGKYVKINLEKILSMSNWREEQLSSQSDTMEAFALIKKLNPVKIGIDINLERSGVERIIERLHTYLTDKLYTQQQYVAIDLTDKAADKVFTITYERKTPEVQTACDFISHFTTHKLKENDYDSIWDKIFLKNKITEKLPSKNISNLKRKI